MRRIIFGIILVGIAVSSVAQMLWQPSAKSDALFAAGVDLYNAGKYREAIPLFAKSDSLDKAQLDSTSNRRDYSSMWLASCYYQLGDTFTAAGIDSNYQFAPVDRRLTVKSDSLSQIGLTCYYSGDYNNAVLFGNEALNICEKVLGKQHPYYAILLNNLASYNYYLGNYAEAIRLGTEALQIREKVLGKEHTDYATSLSNLANYNSSLGNYAEAIRLGTEALQIRKKVLGKEHPDYTLILSNLANYNSSLGNYAEAIRLGTEALQIQEKVLGKEHPDYALSLVFLAVYNKLNRNADAIKYCVEATEALAGIERRTFADLTARERNLF